MAIGCARGELEEVRLCLSKDLRQFVACPEVARATCRSPQTIDVAPDALSAGPKARAPPMNYRHAFHAGNFADVFKHALLARILVYMTRKAAPLRFIDTHAGDRAL